MNRTVYGGGGREVKKVREVAVVKKLKERKLLVGSTVAEVPLTVGEGVDRLEDRDQCVFVRLRGAAHRGDESGQD
jgi:hypothetical protein